MLRRYLAGVAVATALFLARTRSRSPFVLPALLLASVGVFYFALTLGGRAPCYRADKRLDLQSAGEPAVTLTPPWSSDALARFPWRALPSLSGDLLAVMFVTAIRMSLNTTGIEVATRREADLNRDLNTLGVANLLSAALGGYVSCVRSAGLRLIMRPAQPARSPASRWR